MTATAPIVLLPLDARILRVRLETDDFDLECSVQGRRVRLHFGPEFPGDAMVLYPGYVEVAGESGVVDGTFVVVDPVRGEAVGSLGTLGPPTGEVEIGYGINESEHRRGFGTAAVRLLVDLLRARPEITGIVASSLVTNPASGRVLAKNGFTTTGRQPSSEGELLLWAHQPGDGLAYPATLS